MSTTPTTGQPDSALSSPDGRGDSQGDRKPYCGHCGHEHTCQSWYCDCPLSPFQPLREMGSERPHVGDY